jgi:hypothetical protein
VAIVIRPATSADIDAFSSMAGKPSIRAVCMEKDGRIIALGGIAFAKGRWIGFCDLMPEARQHKMHIMRGARRFMAAARKSGVRYIYAAADLDEPRSICWLQSLGFRLDPRSGVLYRWGT